MSIIRHIRRGAKLLGNVPIKKNTKANLRYHPLLSEYIWLIIDRFNFAKNTKKICENKKNVKFSHFFHLFELANISRDNGSRPNAPTIILTKYLIYLKRFERNYDENFQKHFWTILHAFTIFLYFVKRNFLIIEITQNPGKIGERTFFYAKMFYATIFLRQIFYANIF